MVKVGNDGRIKHKYAVGFKFCLEEILLIITYAGDYHPELNIPTYSISHVDKNSTMGGDIGTMIRLGFNPQNFKVTEDFIDECIRRSDLETLI